MRSSIITKMAFFDNAVVQDAGAASLRPAPGEREIGARFAPKKSPRRAAGKSARHGIPWRKALLFPLTFASGIHDLFSGMTLPRKVALFALLVLAAAGACLAALPWLLMRMFLPAADDDDSY